MLIRRLLFLFITITHLLATLMWKDWLYFNHGREIASVYWIIICLEFMVSIIILWPSLMKEEKFNLFIAKLRKYLNSYYNS